MKWKARTTKQVAELICGDNTKGYFLYLIRACSRGNRHYSLSLMCPDRAIEPKNDG
ncbi:MULTISPECIES: hypothetical protein [Pseudomonas]|uniref:Uncharacterized protein n=1 Tax=Pseudomonas tritici TaxID=2745518 RepID=A0A8H9YNU7_9PSED|nr:MULTISPECIES: hypothetical protein [Pseudomonas]MBP2873728.1 hypothetical protein [Pseudomonas sp. SWRI144]QXH86735.1 hypothetical protein HU722_0004365 [Pseudomonas tritici]